MLPSQFVPPPFPLLCPQVHSLHLCLHSHFKMSMNSQLQTKEILIYSTMLSLCWASGTIKKKKIGGGRFSVCVLGLSCVRIFAASRTTACQALLSWIFPRKEYWSGLTFSSPGDLPDLGIKPTASYVSCIGRWVLYHCCLLGSPHNLGQTTLENGSCSQPGECAVDPTKGTQGIPLETITLFRLESQVFSPWHLHLL